MGKILQAFRHGEERRTTGEATVAETRKRATFNPPVSCLDTLRATLFKLAKQMLLSAVSLLFFHFQRTRNGEKVNVAEIKTLFTHEKEELEFSSSSFFNFVKTP